MDLEVIRTLVADKRRGLIVTHDFPDPDCLASAWGLKRLCADRLGVETDIQRIADEALTRFGRIDILVNNAAIIHPLINLVDFDVGVWRQVVDVNLTGAALLTKVVLPSMIENRSGKIIFGQDINDDRGSGVPE